MAAECSAVKKLPSAWWGLFVTFQNERKPHVAAEVWWRNNSMSKFAERPELETLLKSFVSLEPRLIEENLIFCPTFFLLTEYFQKCLLSFLTQHLAELPEQSTQEFLATIQQNIQYVPNNRIQSLFNHFQYNCRLTWNQTFLPNNHFPHVISKQNQEILNDILKSPASTHQYNPFLPSFVREGPQQIPDGNITSTDDVTSPNQQHSLQEQCINIIVPESPVIVIHSDSCSEESMEVAKEGAIEPESSKSTNIPVEESSKPPSPMEVPKPPSPVEVPSHELPPDIEMKANQLKYVWQQGDKPQNVLPPELTLFVECSDQQVHQICHMLDVESLSESSFAMICKHFAEVGNQISYANSLVLAKDCILPRFVVQSKQNSRLLVSAVVTFSQQFPKPFVDGVLIPCAKNKKIDLPQAKLLTIVNKDAFTSNTRLYLLEQLSKSCPSIEPGILLLLENILDGKLELSSDQLSQLLQWLKKTSTFEQHSNSKYGRFLLTFVNKHKKQLKKEHISCLYQIVEHHETFLKNTIISALKTLA
ncbi:uncharacterized protein LOC115213826 [Octopus sinensis]|uniref:Uncharacterized protein LOC115213826 n=1 Tax=Octopus sinensis TaxID=2607531 RepID=A0A6P7SJI0_9MOLL|nr:uncharacterized protein LOC115213826 [Octopus sinensis]XP_036360315.1 uncharacterized protein LOC115213826 [Octopus sinensis]